jgi:hypothetical protein
MKRTLASIARLRCIPLLALAAAACSSSGEEPEPCVVVDSQEGVALLGSDCDPMVPTQCGYPFPSNVYLADDATTVTGKRVAFGATTLPARSGGPHIDAALFSDSDGFSAGQPALTHLPGATITGLPTQDTIELSLTDASPTVLIDAETGERVPHFSELDMSIPNEEDADRALMIRPVVRLKDATRYIVAIRRVVDKDGKAIAPSSTFQALRDGTAGCDISVARRRDLYTDIFARLDKAGVKKDDLQIAWDYTTASRENNTRWLIHMRDQALATVGDEGPEYSIKSVEENPNEHIRRRIVATMKVPLYLDIPGPGGKFVLGEDGMPKQNGTAEYDVLIHIPNKATTGTPGALLQNGHGLFGGKGEGQNGYLAEFADGWNYVAFSVDLVGMAGEDVPIITDALVGDVSGFKGAVDRQHQGVLNSLLAMRMMRGRFTKEALVQFDGKSAIDPTQRYYRGDSQGGIFGGTYMSVTTDVTRGLLGEPGMPYSLLLNRSSDFGLYFVLLRTAYVTGRNIQLLQGLVQMLWDRTEPDGYVPYIRENVLPKTPAHEVLIHVAIGDHQVTPLGAHMMARAIKAKNLAPVNRTVFGLSEDPGPITGAAMVEYDFGLLEAPKTNTPPDSSIGEDPHDKVRVLDASYKQSDEFFRTGVIKAYCSGPCDPE